MLNDSIENSVNELNRVAALARISHPLLTRLIMMMYLREHSLMTSLVFLAIFDLPAYHVLLYNVPFWGLSWTPLPTLIWDVINGRSLRRKTRLGPRAIFSNCWISAESYAAI